METAENQIFEQVREVLSDNIGANNLQIDIESSIHNTPGWDSLTFMAVITQLENKFALKFTAAEISRMFSVKNIIDILEFKIEHRWQ